MTTPARRRVLEHVAGLVETLPADGVRRVGVDGVDGAGKTVFADELAATLALRGTTAVRASVDGFHHRRQVRHRRGRGSPEGFFRDSYDYAALRAALLDPLGPGGDRRVRRAVHDIAGERSVDAPVELVADGSVLVLDGIFLHRPELAETWDLSVFLDVPFAVSVARMAARDGSPPDPDADANRRYVEGQRLYLAECDPRARATVVVDNADLAAPLVRFLDTTREAQ